MKPLYVSFYTVDYTEVAARLVTSLDVHDLPFEVDLVEDLGTWAANCARKPSFLKRKMEQHPGRPIVWIDADAMVVRPPTLLEDPNAFDQVAVCRYKWRSGKVETLSGTIWFGNRGLICTHLMELWERIQSQDPVLWDQVGLALALKDAELEGIWAQDLPFVYCFIHDFHRQEHPDAVPVIEHFQHSRQTRMKGVPK